MKIMVDGRLFEGDKDDLRELFDLNKKEVINKSDNEHQFLEVHKNRKLDWDDIFDKILNYVRLNKDKMISISGALQFVLHRNGGLDEIAKVKKMLKNAKSCDVKLINKGSKTYLTASSCSEEQIKSIRSDDKRRSRAKFMNSRAIYLCQQENMSYQQALKRASDEWIDSKKTSNVLQNIINTTDSEMPILMENNKMNKVLIDMLRHIIANGERLKMYPDGELLLIDTGWEWHDLLAKCIRESSKISSYFSVPNKFVVEKNGRGHEELVYRR